MKPDFEWSATASVLDSGRTLASASNVAAVVAGINAVLGHSNAAQIACALSMLCWFVGCYFAVRVTIDASLFRQLAANHVEACGDLDEWLRRLGWLRGETDRSLTDRTRAALALWRGQVALLALQLMALATRILLGVAGM
jgi:hypothetical protein